MVSEVGDGDERSKSGDAVFEHLCTQSSYLYRPSGLKVSVVTIAEKGRGAGGFSQLQVEILGGFCKVDKRYVLLLRYDTHGFYIVHRMLRRWDALVLEQLAVLQFPKAVTQIVLSIALDGVSFKVFSS